MSSIRGNLYRVLADNEDLEKGIFARAPEATNVKVSAHVNGKKDSPYISTTATKKAIKAYYRLAVKRYEKEKEKKIENKRKGKPFTVIQEKEKTYTVAEIDIDKLLKEKKVEIFDLTIKEERDKYLGDNQKLKNYAKKYDEVLIKGFIPAEYVTVLDLKAMSDDKFSSEGYSKSDYKKDHTEDEEIDEITNGAAGIILDY